MNTLPIHIAHMRLSSAHFPEPLKAPGATFSRPERPASPSNQLTRQSDFRSDRQIETLPRFTPAASRIGGITPRPAIFSFRILAIDALIGIRYAGSQGFRPLAPLPFATAPNQRNFTDPLGSIRPFLPSSLSAKLRLQSERFGGFICPSVTSQKPDFPRFRTPVLYGRLNSSPASELALLLDLSGQFPRPSVMRESDFPGGNHIALFCCAKNLRSPRVRHAPNPIHFLSNPTIVNLIK